MRTKSFPAAVLVVAVGLCCASAVSAQAPQIVATSPGPAAVATVADTACGDVNIDGLVNLFDACLLAHYAWRSGPPPSPLCLGDVNDDNAVNTADMQYLFRAIHEYGYPSIKPCCPFGLETDPKKSGAYDKALSQFGNAVNIDVVREGTGSPVDTLYVGGKYLFRIWVENSENLYGMSIGIRAWATEPVAWSWVAQSNPVNGFAPCVTAEVDSRIEGGNALDYAGIRADLWPHIGDTYYDPPEPVSIAWLTIAKYLPAGSLEHMLSVHFRIDSLTDLAPQTICIDTMDCFHYDGTLAFGYIDGSGVYPQTLWHEGGRCWTVVLPPCGDANSDGAVNVGDAVFLINFVFKSGPAPTPLCVGEANGDDQTNVGDAVYMINFVFKGGPAPVEGCCP
jgi:hypothetical protein